MIAIDFRFLLLLLIRQLFELKIELGHGKIHFFPFSYEAKIYRPLMLNEQMLKTVSKLFARKRHECNDDEIKSVEKFLFKRKTLKSSLILHLPVYAKLSDPLVPF